MGLGAAMFGVLNKAPYIKDKLTLRIIGTTGAGAGSNFIISHFTPILSYMEGCYEGIYGISGTYVFWSFALLCITWTLNVIRKGGPMQ